MLLVMVVKCGMRGYLSPKLGCGRSRFPCCHVAKSSLVASSNMLFLLPTKNAVKKVNLWEINLARLLWRRLALSLARGSE